MCIKYLTCEEMKLVCGGECEYCNKYLECICYGENSIQYVKASKVCLIVGAVGMVISSIGFCVVLALSNNGYTQIG